MLVQQFAGTVPRFSDGIQTNQFAVKSHNVQRETQYLRAVPCPKLVCEVGEPIRTIFENEDCECLTWDECVDVVELPCYDEQTQYIWTGDGAPKMATADEMCAGESCRPGPECPQDAPQFSGAGCDQAGCNTTTTTYVYTYRNRYGDEGPPSNAAALQTVPVGAAHTVTLPQPSAATVDEYCITEICVYRLGVGYKTGQESQTTTDSAFWLVGCVPVGTTTFVDDGEKPKPYRLSTQGLAPMRLGAKNVTRLESGQIAWSLGHQVYVSPPSRPTMYGDTLQAYNVTLKDRVRCMCEWNNDLYVLTDSSVYRLSIAAQDGRYRVQVMRYECEMPLCSKQSLVKGKNAIYYASTHGVVALNQQGPQIISEQLFTREQWCCECCDGMVMGLCYGELILRGKYETYVIPLGEGGLQPPQNIGMSTIDIAPDTFYTRKDGTVLFAEDGKVYELPKCSDDCCDCCEAEYIGPIVSHACPVNYEAMRVYMRPEYGPVRVKIWKRNCGMWELLHEKLVENCDPFLLPACSIDEHFMVQFNFCTAWIDGWAMVASMDAFGGLTYAA